MRCFAIILAASVLAQPSFKSTTELVTVPVIVGGLKSERIDGLTIDDFRLYEDGVLQPLSYARREHPSLSMETSIYQSVYTRDHREP